MISKLTAVLAFVLALASPAWAAQGVELRRDVVNHNGQVTLADLFDNTGDAGAAVVAWGGVPGQSLVLNAGRVQAAALAHGLDWSNARGLKRVIARPDTGPAAQLADAGRSDRPRAAETLVYARDFAAGDIVRAEDLVWSKDPELQIPLGAPRDARSMIGQAAKRALRAGTAASASDVAVPEVIKKDDIVSVAYDEDGIKLVLQGKAMGPAAAGEAFAVINPSSKKVIQAIATGPGQAIVGPRADRLREAMQADPKYLALR